MADLSITIGGDSSDLSEEISRVERQLRTLERRREARVRIGADVGDLDRRISQTNANLSSLRTNLNQTTTAADRFNRSSANGSNTLTQFSRIAQDAPFGIMGIGNNLTATAESFANLSRSAGGAGNALRAVGASLLGSGGILLAISLVTTGLTYMSQQGLTVGDVFDKLTGKFDENAKALSKMAAEAIKNSGEEISGFKALVTAAQNVNLSMQDRLRAVKALQKEYPNYFGNLSKEQILNGNVTSAVQELTTALIQKAKAQLFANKIAELAGQEFTLREKLTKATEKLLDAQNALNKSSQQFQSGGGTLGATGVSGIGRLQSAESTYKSILADLAANVRQQELFTNEINKSTVATLKLNEQIEKPAKTAKEKRAKITQALEFKPIISTDEKEDSFLKIMRDRLSQDLIKFKNTPIDLNIPVQPKLTLTLAELELKRLGVLLEKFNDESDKIINTGIASTFSGLAEAIGGALGNGANVMEAAGSALLSTLGGVLIQLGQLAIQTGVGILAVKTALKTLNPYVAIAAGAALIAVGGMFKGKASKLGGSGGSSGSSGATGRDYSSPASSISSGSGGSFTNGSVVFEISGTSLIGVLSNSLAKNSRIGGTLGI